MCNEEVWEEVEKCAVGEGGGMEGCRGGSENGKREEVKSEGVVMDDERIKEVRGRGLMGEWVSKVDEDRRGEEWVEEAEG